MVVRKNMEIETYRKREDIGNAGKNRYEEERRGKR